MRYQSFRLQVWRSDRFGHAQWCARLEGLQDGRSHRFSSAEALLSHLHMQLDLDQHAGSQRPKHEDNETPSSHDQQERKTDDD